MISITFKIPDKAGTKLEKKLASISSLSGKTVINKNIMFI